MLKLKKFFQKITAFISLRSQKNKKTPEIKFVKHFIHDLQKLKEQTVPRHMPIVYQEQKSEHHEQRNSLYSIQSLASVKIVYMDNQIDDCHDSVHADYCFSTKSCSTTNSI